MQKVNLPGSLNICIVAANFSFSERGSTNAFLWPIVDGLVKQGHTITILSTRHWSGKFEVLERGIRILYLSHAPLVLNKRAELVKHYFLKCHAEKPFHIVHSLDSSIYLIARMKRELRVAVAYDVDATELDQLFGIQGMAQETLGSLLKTFLGISYTFLKTYLSKDRKMLAAADGVFVKTPQQRVILERYYMYPDAKIHQVPYGIEIGDLSPRDKSDNLRKELKIPEGTNIVISISDMTDFGEVEYLLKAFQKVAIKKPHTCLLLVGSGPLFKDIEFEMLSLALGSRVIMTGWLKGSEVTDLIALADVMVNLSARTTEYETCLLEAMAQKKIVIASELNPLATVINDTKDGFLVRPADTQMIANLLIEIFTGLIPLEEIGEQARRKVLNLFDINKMVNETINAYYQILKETGYYRKRRELPQAQPAATSPSLHA